MPFFCNGERTASGGLNGPHVCSHSHPHTPSPNWNETKQKNTHHEGRRDREWNRIWKWETGGFRFCLGGGGLSVLKCTNGYKSTINTSHLKRDDSKKRGMSISPQKTKNQNKKIIPNQIAKLWNRILCEEMRLLSISANDSCHSTASNWIIRFLTEWAFTFLLYKMLYTTQNWFIHSKQNIAFELFSLFFSLSTETSPIVHSSVFFRTFAFM